MKTPKERFKELKSEIEAKKFELKLKSKYANFDYRILVLEAEMKGIAETMEFIYNEEKHHKFRRDPDKTSEEDQSPKIKQYKKKYNQNIKNKERRKQYDKERYRKLKNERNSL